MRCIAVIEAQRPGLDSVLIWDRDGQLVAFAYLEGRVTMTRPLLANDLDTGVNEVLENFQITQGQFVRVTNWQNRVVEAQPVLEPRTRW